MMNCYNIEERKEDKNSFLFTLKNPNGIIPTVFKQSPYHITGITCNKNKGPIFGRENYNLFIDDNCNLDITSYIGETNTFEYTINNDYGSSIFVNSNKPNKQNYFSILDYEIYTINYDSQYTVYHKCHYPDIVWMYKEKKVFQKEMLDQVDNAKELLNDFYKVHCCDENVLTLIKSNMNCILPESVILKDDKYDHYIREVFTKSVKMDLVYRGSRDGFSSNIFHEKCDNFERTLSLVKTKDGSIFCGITLVSWKNGTWISSCM